MKALVVNAEWSPRKDYRLSRVELDQRKAFMGSQVWKNPEFEIKNMPTPNIREDEVLIRVKACGICGSDTHLYEVDEDGYIIFSGLTKLPCILGHEFSGVIEKTGKNVMYLKTGDRVAVESIMWCGMCQFCRSGNPNQCKNIELLGLSSNGALAEFISVHERYCWNINELTKAFPEKAIYDIGSLIEPAGCAYNGIFIAGGGFKPGDTLAVYGAGPIGLGAVALGRISGASMIIAFDVIEERLNIAKKMGADYVFHFEKSNGNSHHETIMELTKGRGIDIHIEAAGAAPVTIPEMEKSLAPNGKIIYLGRAATSTPMYLDILVSGANKVIGSRGHSGYGIFPNIITLLASGKLDLSKMITARYPFKKVLEALKASVKRTDGKILVKN